MFEYLIQYKLHAALEADTEYVRGKMCLFLTIKPLKEEFKGEHESSKRLTGRFLHVSSGAPTFCWF